MKSLKEFDHREFIRFLAVGGAGTVLNMAIFVPLVYGLRLAGGVAATISFVCAASSNYYWNRVWTFKFKGKGSVSFHYAEFLVLSTMTWGVNVGILMAAVRWLGCPQWLGQLAGIGVGTMCNFAGNKLWVFSRRRNQRIVNREV